MNFDHLAPHYRWMEWVLAGDRLQACRTLHLGHAVGARAVLLTGEGNGRFLTECRRRMPDAHITCLDDSRAMLQQAERRMLRSGFSNADVVFVHANVLAWTAPPASFDLIVTHFFLDCFRPEQLRQVVTNLAAAATPSAQWLLSDFRIPASGPSRVRARIVHWIMYGFFRAFAGLPARQITPPDDDLRAAGFRLIQRRFSEWGLLHSDRWARGEPIVAG